MTRQSGTFWIVLSAAVVCLACGLAVSPQPNVASTQVAGLAVQSPAIDLGVLSPLETATATFQLHNTGRRPLILERVVTSCGCTVAELTASTLQPGEHLALPVTVNAAKLGSTHFHQSVSVIVRQQGKVDPQVLKLHVLGDIDRSNSIVAVPGIIDFGEVAAASVARRSIRVYGDAGALESLPEEISHSGRGEVLARFEYEELSSRLGEKTVSIAMKFGTTVGLYDSSLKVIIDGPKQYKLVLPIRAHVGAPIRALPQQIFATFSAPEQQISLDICFRSLLKSAVAVANIRSDLPLKWSRPAGADATRLATEDSVTVILRENEYQKLVSTGSIEIEFAEAGQTVALPVIVMNLVALQ